ncbi:hypothetical protein BCV69DRAFT_299986 [Microstroma glucosiphilum]|uniref:GIY-YIG domain-containing protein n=1 Tax=Pseudomicrostroma glucosiphilum TaxID=1684307 RepID=A0A316U2Y3_9BASI|nr:hypothetical protein BCV69DRAFT_299986 [Pseudomicrostroma glucosiphilum]PWN19676.1 hypothetical protein BCV69DRAFT_299986 [Pseudomicrostroma glucosiphilum]
MVREAANVKLSGQCQTFPDVHRLRSESPAGVYLIVGCKKDKVAALYVGQSNDVFRRTLEHQIVYEDKSLPAEQDRRLAYHLLKTCDEVYHFRLAQFAVKEKQTRTMAEGLWCLVAGIFQVKKEWLECRRKFGLVNVGDRVRGGNSTRCFDKPREERAGATGEHGFQDGQ